MIEEIQAWRCRIDKGFFLHLEPQVAEPFYLINYFRFNYLITQSTSSVENLCKYKFTK